MLSRLSEIKEVVTLSPSKLDKQVLCDVAVLLIEFESNFNSDSVERRIFLTIIEKMLQILWDSFNFRLFQPSNEIDLISRIFLNSVGTMQFCGEKFWRRSHIKRKDPFNELLNSINKLYMGTCCKIKIFYLVFRVKDKNPLRFFYTFTKQSQCVAVWFSAAMQPKTSSKLLGAVDNFWFGGRLIKNDQTDGQRSPCNASLPIELNFLKFISICTILIASASELPARLVEGLFQKLFQNLCGGNTVDVVISLMENDERCMCTLLALLEIKESGLYVGNSFDPMVMFLLLIKNIQFDTQVVVDWLQSETVSIPFLMRFFKAMSQFSKEAMLNKFNFIDISTRTSHKVISHGLPSIQTSEGATSSKFLFEIEELHGEHNIIRHVQIPVKNAIKSDFTTKNSATRYKLQDEQQPFEESFTGFVVRLQLQLEKLGKLLPFNVNPIIRVLSNVEKILEG